MRTEVATSHLRVTPGIPVVLDVDVTNTANVIDGVTASIQGLDPSWVSLVIPVVSLFPDSSSTVSLRIDLPRNCLAGEYLVSVRVESIIDPERFSEHEFWLSVEPLVAASVVLHPSVVTAGKQAVFQAAITNEGNVTADLVVNTVDETRALTCVAYPATVSVPPGETHSVEVHANGKRPFFGQSISRTITIDVSGGGVALDTRATFVQKPRIPRGVLTVLILVLILALWAVVFLVVVNALRDKSAVTKTLGENFTLTSAAAADAAANAATAAAGGTAADGANGAGGTASAGGAGGSVELAAVAVTLSGTVTSVSDGAPVPLITVEAYRIKPSGDMISVASTGTIEDGTYSFASLLPGHYKLRFSATGFDELWFPAAPDAGSATELKTDPASVVEGLDVVMAGKPGSLSGEIVADESQGAAPQITVSVLQVIATPKEGEPAPVAMPAPVDGAGKFSLSGLATPATYAVHIEAVGFDDRDFSETLTAGENRVINTVTLGAGLGSLSGSVVDGAGNLLGGVDVTVRSGDFVKATKTPTSGNVGAYLVDGLETPRTYIITFSLAGYADQTISLDLGSGENATVPGMLVGGTGALSGLITDSTGAPLGGVTVEVRHGAFLATTSTLTASGAIGQAGTYSVAGLPTPGAYTLTFSSPGYDSQTIRVDLARAASAADLNAVLPRTNGSVTGTVTNVGVPISDVIVELSSGSTPLSTATASNPAGVFRFPDVAPGTYTLTFRRSGVATRVVIVTVTGDQATTRNIDLPSSS